jgi:uncharacterized membrane protein
MNSKFTEKEEQDRMRRDPDNYKWGIFYFNPDDSRLFLPKRNPFLGYTLNFANSYSYLILIAIFALALFLNNFVS